MNFIKKISYALLIIIIGATGINQAFAQDSEECKVSSVTFEPNGQQIDPNFLNPEKQETLKLTVVTENCVNAGAWEPIYINILTRSNWNNDVAVKSTAVFGAIPSDGIIEVIYKPGDEGCDETLDGKDYCNYGVSIWNALTTTNKLFESPEGSVENQPSKIGFYCNDNCGDEKWEVVHKNFTMDNSSGPEVVNVEKKYDVASPCYDPDTEEYRENCYEPLVTLPGAGGNVYQTDENTNRQFIDFNTFQLGDYVNFIFKLALGVLMVLSVIMIIIAGVQYMTVESIYGKSNARSRITNAVTGLLVALGIFIILSTINPRLVENVNFTPPTAKISFNSEAGDGFNYSTPPEGYPSAGDVPTDGSYKPTGCPQGIVLVNDIHICTSMAKNLEDLMADAADAGFTLTGGGFRSGEQQIWLREKNCQPNPETKPSKDCTPPTARPGRSNHEAGLAVDFRCNSQPMGGTCLQWMKNNAGKHGFINLPSEAWHWSHNGR